jgi:hypothetical protein
VTTRDEPEPSPLSQLEAFDRWDFASLEPARAKDSEYDARRLVTRRKLAAIAKAGVARIARDGLKLESRSSLHRPTTFNGMRVQRLWSYACRGKAEKTRLRKVLGRDLAKDLDAAYRNAYLCVGVEADAIEVSLRIHPDGWYDGQNLIRRVKAEGLAGWLERLNALDGYFLRLADWKGEWRCGSLTVSSLEEFLRHYTPGDHALAVERRWPVPKDPGPAQGAVFGQDVPQSLVEELPRLAPLYRYTAWSAESDFLFTS